MKRYDSDDKPHFAYTSFDTAWAFTWNGKEHDPVHVHDGYQGRIIDTFLITGDGELAVYEALPHAWVTWFRGACDNYIKLHKKKDPVVIEG